MGFLDLHRVEELFYSHSQDLKMRKFLLKIELLEIKNLAALSPHSSMATAAFAEKQPPCERGVPFLVCLGPPLLMISHLQAPSVHFIVPALPPCFRWSVWPL